MTEAVDLIMSKGIGCLPVVKNDQLIGIVTKTNLLQRLRTLSATEREHENSPDKT